MSEIRVAGYARVSTRKQSLFTQRQMLTGWARERGVGIEIFEDRAVPRTIAPAYRPGWAKLLEYLGKGGVAAFCYEDRLGSEPWGLIGAAARLDYLGVSVVCLHPSPRDSISWAELRMRSDADIVQAVETDLTERNAGLFAGETR
jgi:hypothetical protein